MTPTLALNAKKKRVAMLLLTVLHYFDNIIIVLRIGSTMQAQPSRPALFFSVLCIELYAPVL